MSRIPIVISLTQAAGTDVCVSLEDGARVHDIIIAAFDDNKDVILSFGGVNRLTTAFLNAAVGQLYNEYDEDFIRNNLLPPQGATGQQLILLKRVVDNAKIYFANRRSLDEAMRIIRKDD